MYFRPFVFRLLVPVLLCGTMSGCMALETVVRVRPDGSGLIEQVVLLTAPALDVLSSMPGTPPDARTLLREADLKAQAAAMGRGVRLFSAVPVTAGDARGYRAVFAFDDVRTLRIDRDPAAHLPEDLSPRSPASLPSAAPLTFAFSAGPPATLRISLPHPDPTASDSSDLGKAIPSPTDSTELDQALATLSAMLQESRFLLSVEVEGAILKTDATYADAHRVTLQELDAGRMLADKAGFRRLLSARPGTADEALALFSSLPGVRLEPRETVTIRFR